MKQFTIQNKPLTFVIHKHHATSLHYDFRLEVGRVMPSWAVPKGLTLDPTKKRLAMKTPDHALSYRLFEGNLPVGSYGAGPVMIWDEGIYIPEIEISKGVRETVPDRAQGNEVMKEGIKKGEIKFFLKGKKIKGSFALVKTHGFGGENAWLFIKHKDTFAQIGFDANDETYAHSVASGKTLDEIRRA